MRYTILSENIPELVFENNVRIDTNVLDDTEITDINRCDFGEIHIKNQQLRGFNLIEWNAVLNRPIEIIKNESYEESMFALHFNLGSLIGSTLNGRNNNVNSKSHNIWSFSGDEKMTGYYKPSDISQTFSIVIEEDYLKKMVNYYPDLLTEIYDAHTEGLFNRWNKFDAPINNDINLIINQIQNANLIGKCRSVYIEAKVLELLVLQLNCPNKQNCCLGKFCKKPNDIDKMHEARRILLQNIVNPPTIYELSRKVGMNDFKLKNGFKEVFNQTVYGCLFEYKMSLAYQLLLESNKTISEIGYECGYDYASHFSTAFKRRFGLTPSIFRKKE